MEITTENVCEIFFLSICYNDEFIKDRCGEFIKVYYNDDIIIGLIKIMNRFENGIKDLESLVSIEYEKRGYKYLYNGINYI